MNMIETKLPGVFILEPKVFGDHRGYFMESYNKNIFDQLGLIMSLFRITNRYQLLSVHLRGLHFQLNPKAQTKVVRCITGAIYDVAVDIRKGSPTYGQWVGVILSEHNKRQLVVPKGFAHGFCTIVAGYDRCL